MKGDGFGLIGNIVVGIIGAVIAGWLLPRIGFVLVRGLVAAIINAVIGAVILLFVIRLFKKQRESRRLTFGASPRRAPRPSNQGCFEAQKWGGFKTRSQVEAKSMRWRTWFSGLNSVAGGQQHAKRTPPKPTTMLYVPASFGQLPHGQNWLNICPTN
jgi:uncharacterized membrane protein YeaQ/YmgE (transglycosylase-associated protein family)